MAKFTWTQRGPCSGCIYKHSHICRYGYCDDANIKVQAAAHRPLRKTFLDLPPELCIQIYTTLFTEPAGRTTSWWQPSITLTCRQLRHEALPVFYACTHFFVEVFDDVNGAMADVSKARRWIRSIGADNVRILRKVTLRTELLYEPGRVQDFPLALEIDQQGLLSCQVAEPERPNVETIEAVEYSNEPLARSIKALTKSFSGRVWSQKTFLKVLGGFRKIKARTAMEDMEYSRS